MQPNKEQIFEVVRQALLEFMLTGKAGIRIPRAAFPAYWDIFYKSLGWRLDNLYGEKIKKAVGWTSTEAPLRKDGE